MPHRRGIRTLAKRLVSGAIPAAHVVWVALALVVAGAQTARAQIGSERYSSVVMDAGTGNTLSAVSADEQRYPASLTKMMTLYMVFEAVRDRRIRLDQNVPVSFHAAAASPTKLGLLPSTRISVEEAILGLVTKSANDAAAALGELLGGDEDRFGQMMTLRARALGMSHTVFRNASGLPDPDQVTTAHDMALLARHLIQDFPSEYRYFSTPSFVFHGRMIYSHDGLLKSYPGADGLKTGYTEASGFNLVTSAVRGDVRLIGVVMGAAHPGERDLHMASLLDQGFERMDVPPVAVADARRGFGGLPALVATAQAAPLAAPLAPSVRRANLVVPEAPPAPRATHTQPRWALQVGTFGTESAARQAAAAAHRIADDGDARIEPVTAHRRTLWRAQLGGFTAEDARDACAELGHRHMACSVIRPEGGQLASR